MGDSLFTISHWYSLHWKIGRLKSVEFNKFYVINVEASFTMVAGHQWSDKKHLTCLILKSVD